MKDGAPGLFSLSDLAYRNLFNIIISPIVGGKRGAIIHKEA